MKRSHRAYDIFKRFFDVLAAVALLALLGPVMVLIALAVRIADGPPVLFKQERPGRDGRTFVLYKFRTMAPAGEVGDLEAVQTDEVRLTRLGRFLRSTSLDELPQLLNVLLGHMSLVGPRPLLTEYLRLYTPEQARRHEVRPGITGWAQVNGRNATSWRERLAMDVWYVDHRSLPLDLRILGRTFGAALRREGISGEGRATMEPFKGSGAEEDTCDS